MKFIFGILVLGAFTTVSQSQADAPVFEPLFSPSGVQTSVDERAPEGTLVLSVRAQGSAAETILYGIELPSTAAGVFVADLSSGDITVGPNGTDRLAIRGGNPTTFVIQAFAYYSSAGPSGERTYLMVTVDVRDFNDPPLFVDQETDLAVTEGAAVGYVVYRFTATDNDMSSNGAVTYSREQLAPAGGMGSHFTIQPFTGDLIVAQSLDLSEVYQLRISATDEGVPPLNASLLITVRVNPAPPLFNDFIYSASVLEFNSEVPVNLTTVSARDVNPSTSPGIIQYGVLTWSPLNNEVVFAMDPNLGLLTIAGNVDREAFSRYVVTVTSFEQGYADAFSEASVVVEILNVNEPPRFLSSHYGTTVSEGAGLGEVVFSGLEAVDPDEGDSTGLTYSILELEALQTIDGQQVFIEEPLFLIEPSTGVISLNGSLERDARERGFHYYEITVVVIDGGSSALSASTVVAVAVIDINDNPPVFNNTSYSFSLSENEPAGSQVGEFMVSDSDEGAAATLTFTVVGAFAERFDAEVVSVMHPISAEIRPPTVTRGRIVTRLPLDREETEFYSLYVIAMDTSGTPLNATAAVAITVLDRNDNVPKFSTSNFTFDVPEDAGLDTLIMEFNVTDADVGSNREVDYILEEGVALEQFTLVPSGLSVRLHLDGPLDRESVDLYSFRIFATDRGMPALIGEARIYIIVTDVNDNPPVFVESPYRATVPENTPIGTEIVTVRATDQDIGLNGLLSYLVAPGLQIQNETGVVTLDTELDFETMDELTAVVLVIDSGGNFDPEFFDNATVLFDNTTIIITIVDVNDNAPVFQNAPITFSVSEAAGVGAEVGVVLATDLDSGSFGEVTYNITGGNEDGTFLLNNVTGSLLVADSLDREAVDLFSITVEARDGGDPARSSEMVITVTVLDVNDNAPEFIGEPYLVEVSEGFNGSVGVLIFTLSAVDADDGSNADLRFSIAGSGEAHFTVNETTGEIRVSSEGLDYERVLDTPFVLAVTAYDLVTAFAKKTGDYQSLSVVDLQVMALTYQLECELGPTRGAHLKREPARTQFVSDKPKVPGIVGFYSGTKRDEKTEEGKKADASCEDDLVIQQVPDVAVPGNETETSYSERTGGSAHQDPDSCLEKNVIDEKRKEHTEAIPMEQNQDDNQDWSGGSDEEWDEDSDDSSGWITPENLQQVCEEMGGATEVKPIGIAVGCITTDFAMQNVMLQMGLNVISVAGMRIKQLRTYAMKCKACFKTTTKTSEIFCPSCGHRTLIKVSMAIDAEGVVHCHPLSQKQFSHRGLKYSLPLPKGGRHADTPILTADQKNTYRERRRRVKKVDPLDPDYIARSSPFAAHDITSRASRVAFAKGGGGRGGGRRNPNAVRPKGKRK